MTDYDVGRLEEDAREALKASGDTYGAVQARALGEGILDLIERLRATEEQLSRIDAFVNPEDSERGAFEAVEDFYVRNLELVTRSIVRAKAAEARVKELDDACRKAHRELFLGGGSTESTSAAESILSATIN